MEEKLQALEAIMKKFFIVCIFIGVALTSLIIIEVYNGARIARTEVALVNYIHDEINVKAVEIIDWNIKEGASAVEIYTDWESRQWSMSIGNLKHVLSSDIGRDILVEHFGEEEIVKLEEAIEADK